jgi:hypothetical protein
MAFVIVTRSWLQLYSRLFEHTTSIMFFRLRTVWSEMLLLRIPGVRLAMSTAVTKRLRNWISVMCLSCGNVVSRGLPLPEGNMILVGEKCSCFLYPHAINVLLYRMKPVYRYVKYCWQAYFIALYLSRHYDQT